MSTLRTRASKGSALTHAELDANFKRTVSQKTTTYACLVSDNRSTIEGNHATTAFTVTLGDATTMAAAETGDYQITFTNIGAAAMTVAPAGTDTIDGSTSSLVLAQHDTVTLQVASGATDYRTIAKKGGTQSASTLTVTGDVTVSNTAPTLLLGDSTLSTGDAKIEIGDSRTGDGLAYIDFHGSATADYDAKILRNLNANGALDIINKGTGSINIKVNNTEFALSAHANTQTELYYNNVLAFTTTNFGIAAKPSGNAAYASVSVDSAGTNNAYIFFTNTTNGHQARITSVDGGELRFSTDAGVTQALTLDSANNATFAGDVAVTGEAQLEAYSEDANSYTVTTGTKILDTSLATYFYPTGAMTAVAYTITFSNPVATGRVTSVTVELNNAAASTGITWTGVIWATGVQPTWTAGIDIASFITRDGGTTWYGFPGGLNMS